MMGYVKAGGCPVDGFEAYDALEEVRHDVHGAALALVGMTEQGTAIQPAQVEFVAGVLCLAADELEAVAEYFKGAAK